MNLRVLVSGRQCGKTSELLKWVRSALPDDPNPELRVIVTHTRDRASQLRDNNPDLESWQFMSFDELRHPSRGTWDQLRGRRGRIVLGIDDLELSLTQMLPDFTVGAVTMTGVTW